MEKKDKKKKRTAKRPRTQPKVKPDPGIEIFPGANPGIVIGPDRPGR